MNIGAVLIILIRVVDFLILVRVLMSWLPLDPRHQLAELIYQLTEPILLPIRRILPQGRIPMDFSPIVAWVLLGLLEASIKRYF